MSCLIPSVVALAFAASGAGAVAGSQAVPKTALVQAERILQDDRSWKPTSIYCAAPKRSAYRSQAVAGGVEETYRCEWVKQSNAAPWAIDTIHAVYDAGGRYLFSLVSGIYAPVGPNATCRVEPSARGYHATCQKT